MRAAGIFLALLISLLHAPAVWAHASLVRTEPADGSVVAQPPAALKLIFNETVAPLVMRLITPDGEATTPGSSAENTTVTVTVPMLQAGTHVLSWRVTSADGHPLSGSILFSVGAPSPTPGSGQLETDPAVKAAFWVAKLILYIGLFIGIGGAAFTLLVAQIRPLPARLGFWLTALMAAGIVGATVSLGLQGLDATALPLPELWRPAVWRAGASTSYALTVGLSVFSLVLGIAALRTSHKGLSTILSVVSVIGLASALAASGHASTADPAAVSRASVFLHVLMVTFWIGSLLPLLVIVRSAPKGETALARFSRIIPFALIALAATGVFLIYVQFDRPDALWTTDYGLVLSAKLAAVLTLLALGAANRYWLVPRYEANAQSANARPLVKSIAIEFTLALAIFATVALWRFTPPPRALAMTEPISVHLHGAKAMAQVEIEPVRARGAMVLVQVSNAELEPLSAKELSLVLSNQSLGIEPVRRAAVSDGEGTWRIDDLRVPIAGRWHLKLEILVSDFEMVPLDGEVNLPRAP